MTKQKKIFAYILSLLFILSLNNKIDTLNKEKETINKEQTITLTKKKHIYFLC